MKFKEKESKKIHTESLGNTQLFILIAATTVLLIIVSVFQPLSSFLISSPSSSLTSDEKFEERCDIFTGDWIPDIEAPYYTNGTCRFIHEQQDCMKNGRPDTEFMKWRWKPAQCEMPLFDSIQFLEIMRGKSLTFVGDSVARNQMDSLRCLLSRVMNPVYVSSSPLKFDIWFYPTYNFTVRNYWSPFLIKAKEDPNGSVFSGLYNLYLDELEESWTSNVENSDYVIVSAGQWFYRPAIFYQKGKPIGCHLCDKKNNLMNVTNFYGYRMAFRMALGSLIRSKKFHGTVFLRTFSPSHFEGGMWNKGGDCKRTMPLKNNETKLMTKELEFYLIQTDEFRAAEKEAKKKGLKYRLLDTTQASWLRPDGHPSRFGRLPKENGTRYNDCVHWCLPGPIDVWNTFFFHMLKTEAGFRVSKTNMHRDRKMKNIS